MTSLAVRWLSRAAKYLEVSPLALTTAARWLADAQQPDGSWNTAPAAQRNDPRAQARLPLAAHALLALQQLKVCWLL